jgi:hypothetical protein
MTTTAERVSDNHRALIAAQIHLLGMGYAANEGFVAGGRALQTLFPAFPTKDTDLFIFGEPTSAALSWLSSRGATEVIHSPQAAAVARWPEVSEVSSAYDPAMGASQNFKVTRNGEAIDIVFSSFNAPAEVLRHFDLGVCQVGYLFATGFTIIAPPALADLVAHTVTIMRPAPTENNTKRALKYAQKLGWPIVRTPAEDDEIPF